MLKNPFDINQHWFRQRFYYRQTIAIICHIVDRFLRWFIAYTPGLLQRRHVARCEIFLVMDKNFRFLEQSMMTSSNGNIFRVTGPLGGKFAGHQWIPHTKASDAELSFFRWSATWRNGWVNNREAGGLRRQGAYYDVIVMRFDLAFHTMGQTTFTGGRGTFHLECFHRIRIQLKIDLSAIPFSSIPVTYAKL